jgi:predicted  nucleic acid-binding Zn-ribbon protein
MNKRKQLIKRQQAIADQIADLEEELQQIEEELEDNDPDTDDLTEIIDAPNLGILDEMIPDMDPDSDVSEDSNS